MTKTRIRVATLLVALGAVVLSGCQAADPEAVRMQAGLGRGAVQIAASAVDDLARALGSASRRVDLPEAQIGTLAREAGVETEVVADTARSAASNSAWRRVSTSVEQLYNATSGPERSAVVATACDYFVDGNASVGDLALNLAKAHAGRVPATRMRLLVDDTNKLIRDLQKSVKSPDPYERAAIPMLCYAVGQVA